MPIPAYVPCAKFGIFADIHVSVNHILKIVISQAYTIALIQIPGIIINLSTF